MKKVLADFQRLYVATLPANNQAAAAALLLDIQGDAGASRSAQELEKLAGPNFLRLFEVLAEDGILTYLAVPTVDGEPVYVLRALPEVSLSAQPYFNETERLYIRRAGENPYPTSAILRLGSWDIFTQTTRQGYGSHTAGDFNNVWLPEIIQAYQEVAGADGASVARLKLPGTLRNVALRFRQDSSQLYWTTHWSVAEKGTPTQNFNRGGSIAALGFPSRSEGDFDKETQHYPGRPDLNANLAYLRELITAEAQVLPELNAATMSQVLATAKLPYPQGSAGALNLKGMIETPLGVSATTAVMDTLNEALPGAPRRNIQAVWTPSIRPDLVDEQGNDTEESPAGLGYERTTNPYAEAIPEPTAETVIRHKTNQTQELYANIEEYVQKGLPVYLFISEEEITLTVSEDTASFISKQYAEMVGKSGVVVQVKSLSKVVRQVVSLFAR